MTARRSKGAQPADPVAILTWLDRNPVPGGPSPESRAWRDRVNDLGVAAVPTLIYALEFAPVDVQYTAQMALRELGWNAWAHGYGADLYYTVTTPDGEDQRVDPIMRDEATASVAREPAPPYATTKDPEQHIIERVKEASREMDAHRQGMAQLGTLRSTLVRELLGSGLSRAEIARRLGVHPNYVNQLAKGSARQPSGQ